MATPRPPGRGQNPAYRPTRRHLRDQPYCSSELGLHVTATGRNRLLSTPICHTAVCAENRSELQCLLGSGQARLGDPGRATFAQDLLQAPEQRSVLGAGELLTQHLVGGSVAPVPT